jgi:hypothetical protein
MLIVHHYSIGIDGLLDAITRNLVHSHRIHFIVCRTIFAAGGFVQQLAVNRRESNQQKTK